MSEPIDIRSLWDAATVHDRRPPTPHEGAPCGLDEDGMPTAAGLDGFLCSRKRGHSGQHVAVATPGFVVAVWPGDAP